ncbi:VOC family protein [Aquihabitans daechungensis]|uniref:VOC family protein n=1 Tax=Aquihabitans daechungensis TaxID=1052257 RepID=UPI003BA21E2D
MEAGAGQGRVDARLVEIQVADDPAAWTAAGFAVDGDRVAIGTVAIRLTGAPSGSRRRGMTGWTVSGLTIADGSLDGLATSGRTDASTDRIDDPPGSRTPHPNGVVGLDHVVVLTPDLERTIEAIEAAGLDLRRVRETSSNGSPMRQAFFKLGPVVLEVVSGDVGSGAPAAEEPATFFGLAVDAEDLEVTAAALGEGLGRIKPAVQAGRRIATIRTKGYGISVAIAAMDRHGDRTTPDDGR